ncbi:poly [ADP-ribose] polymerase [Orussus abietinus]|uniref:poly [ADP-ribose] polymerase n=1 Tax=Orussus abietinus TaxID=222816 RepID=UPI0006250B15|nr:poly [ADP-ribose] polymerase [Orussus abietinus]
MADDFPYRVEYSKSSRASCQACKNQIAKETLRLAVIVQSPFHDGKIPKWYHAKCFFLKQRPQSTNDIEHFDSIRWEDQQELKKKIEAAASSPGPAAGKGKKRSKAGGGESKDFKIEYAKSSRAACRGCEEKITKGEIRISKKDYETDDAKRYGGIDRWHHAECFAKLRAELQFLESGEVLAGFKSLSKEDQAMIKKSLPEIKEEEVPVKKIKTETDTSPDEKLMKEQNQKMFALRDQIATLTKPQQIEILEHNEQYVPSGVSSICDLLADVMTFGSLEPCSKCAGKLTYKSGVGYHCTGDLMEWAKCEFSTDDPKRKPIRIPSELKETIPFLEAFKPKVEKRLIKKVAPSTSSQVKKEDQVDSGPKIQGKPKPLKNMQFVILGRTQKDKEELKKEIAHLGGKVVTKIHDKLAAVISNPTEVGKMNKRMEEVKAQDIQVVTEDFIEEAKEFSSAPFMLIKKKSICDWGSDPQARLAELMVNDKKSKSKSRFEKSPSGKVKLRVKGGGAVDPDSGLENEAHVYEEGKVKYTVSLGITDIQAHKNSYYKMQILKHDKRNKFWQFRSWGRIGTTIGGTKLDKLDLDHCIDEFKKLYEEKTGNLWTQRDHFVKVPHKMYPLDLDHGEDDENTKKLFESDIPSKLKKPVQDLIRLIFDVETMKKVMMEFEIDMDKMPLGKISKKQIQQAYAVLTEVQRLVSSGDADRTVLIDATNRFYTLIPHDFGIADPKVLSTVQDVQEKLAMLEALDEMEIAYNLLHGKTDASKNPIDGHYEQLNADIDVLERSSKEFKLIEEYVKNTHAPTHTQYALEIEEVFVVKRNKEDQRYKPFKKLHNKKLLWHGSRTTNFAGIISQGLRIAPPEAPVTGYMFGKGIYFADMVTKSANYCCTNSQSPTGLLLLCEVALGNMYERYQSDYIEKLPKGKHSTLGLGQTIPDPSKVYTTEEGVEVPYGPPIASNLKKKSALLYNEYIVYDVAQVKTQYLVRMNFKYKVKSYV